MYSEMYPEPNRSEKPLWVEEAITSEATQEAGLKFANVLRYKLFSLDAPSFNLWSNLYSSKSNSASYLWNICIYCKNINSYQVHLVWFEIQLL